MPFGHKSNVHADIEGKTASWRQAGGEYCTPSPHTSIGNIAAKADRQKQILCDYRQCCRVDDIEVNTELL